MMNYNEIKVGILILLAGALMAACTAQPAPEDPSSVNGMVLRATMPDGVSKTALAPKENNVYKVLWKEGDRISVNGTLSEAVAAEDDGEMAVDFTVNGSLSAPYNVLHPGTTSDNVISLPDTQNYVADSFDPAAAASFGVATKSGDAFVASLKHFCGILRFALNGSATLSKIELNSLGSEKLYGDFTISNFGTGAFSGGSAGTLTYSFGSGLQLSSTDTPIYVAIPAQTYASGIEALVYQSDGAFMRLKFWGSGNELSPDDIIEFDSKTFAAGRTENLFSIAELNAEAGGEPTAAPPSITVATYNVTRLDDDNRPAAATSGDSNGKIARPENAIVKDCAEMQAALGQAIYNTAADLIGFNEIGDGMYASGQAYSLQDMAEDQGASYTWKLNFPSSKSSGNYHYSNGFAYKSSVLTLEDSGRAWLRANSNSYSASSDSDSGSPNRYVVWGLFTHKVSGKQFYFFVTHLPTYSQDGGNGTSNLNMSGGVNAFAASKTAVNRRILVGDTNSAPGHKSEAGYNKLKEYWSDSYEAVNAAGNLSSFYQIYSGSQSGTGEDFLYSIFQFCKNHPERRIDHIMTQGSCTATSYRTIRTTYEFGTGDDAVTCAPSSHLPVVCTISLD